MYVFINLFIMATPTTDTKGCLLVSLRCHWIIVCMWNQVSIPLSRPHMEQIWWCRWHPEGDFIAGMGGGGKRAAWRWCGRGREDPSSQKQQHKLSEPEVPVSRISFHPEFKITPPRWHPAAAPGGLTWSPWKQTCTKHTKTIERRPALRRFKCC